MNIEQIKDLETLRKEILTQINKLYILHYEVTDKIHKLEKQMRPPLPYSR